MKQQKPRRNFHKRQNKKSAAEAAEIDELERVIAEQAPPRGTNPLQQQQAQQQQAQQQEAGGEQQQGGAVAAGPPTLAAARKFEELPLSRYTKDALRDAKFVSMTAIQRAALPHALCGRDVLGAAKTGSGKTLAFLIPVMEKLYRAKWTKYDGLGALVISPTRELALQIFDELRKVGKRHELSAGLLIGGKDVKEEQDRINGMNLLVCTPGRLLQHMDETPGFDASNLQMLVLDEADRILDMGFSATLNAIVANIPRARQTLLFSATQTKSVKDLARLSLKDPEYISVHAEASAPTPLKLQQAYMVCPLQDKMDILWSFIKTHLKAKVIVFVSTCKQVRFLYEAFRKLRPGVPLRALHGRMNQYKRMGVFYEFCEAKAMVLFATDIAARGLDFPTVDWVVQADCPEDVASYIHRVGRTARYVSVGRALLLLLPSEKEGMLKQLEEAKVPIKQMKHNPAKLQAVTPALQALLSKDAELKEVAQRALISYLRSIFLQPNHAVFDVTALPAAEFALSLGLPTAPKLRFLKRAGKKVKEIAVGGPASEEEAALMGGSHGEAAAAAGAAVGGSGAAATGKGERRAAGGGAGGSSDAEEQQQQEEDVDEDEDDDLLVVKRRDVYGVGEETAAAADEAAGEELDGRGGKKKKKLRIDPNRPSAGGASRVVFDEEGRAVEPLALLGQREGDEEEEAGGRGEEGLHVGVHSSAAERAAAARALMVQRDRQDKEKLRELRKAMRDEKKAKRKAREAGVVGAASAVLAGPRDDSHDSASDYSGSGGEESEDDEGAGASGSEGEGEEEDRAHRWRPAGDDSGSDSDEEFGKGEVDLLESSDDEGPALGQGNREAATLGMLPSAPKHAQQQQQRRQQQRGVKRHGPDEEEDEAGSSSSGEEEERAQQPRQQQQQQRGGRIGAYGEGGRSKRAKSKVEGLSLADQEALALQLLSGKR